MLNFRFHLIKLPIFIALLTLLVSACQQPATYAPVQTVNQAILTDDEIKLREAREQRRQSQIKSPDTAPPPVTTPPEPIDSTTAESSTYAEKQLPSPVSPQLLPPARPALKTVDRAKSKSASQLKNKKIGIIKTQNNHKTEKNVNLAAIQQPSRPSEPSKEGTNKPVYEAHVDPIKQAKHNQSNKEQQKKEKNLYKKTSSISNINKKMLKLNFQWPIFGKVVKNFSQLDHKGIDIAGKSGQLVRASEAGKTVYCGDSLAGYGNLVIVKHDEIFLSAYAHNSRLKVKEGEIVEKGQAIAEIGKSRSSQPVLHFQIRKNGKSINPLTLLPKH